LNLADKMKNRALFLVLLLLVFSCSVKNKIPPLLTDVVSPENLVLSEKLNHSSHQINSDSLILPEIPDDFRLLLNFHNLYFENSKDFDVETLQQLWERVKMNQANSELNYPTAKIWFKISGLLLQITGEAKYAEEMEKVVFTSFQNVQKEDIQDVENTVAPYIFTRNVDHIHVNIFTPSEISYEHSLHGKVKIVQQPDFSESGDFNIRFGMEQKQYIELFVRIPSWAEGATVTVKKVKYFAPPGGYCLIAKKWKEGDIVEIHFPAEKIPDYLKTTN
jgi:hypothetical protein